MADADTLFWPSLYARLVPSRYGRSPQDAPPRFGQRAFFTDHDTLRRHVETELVSLLNSACLESALLASDLAGLALTDEIRARRAANRGFDDWPFEDAPELRTSILNYGLPAIIGAVHFNLTAEQFEQRLRDAIVAFEPRLRPGSISVEIESQINGRIDTERALTFKVRGEIAGAGGARVRLELTTVWDAGRSDASVVDARIGR